MGRGVVAGAMVAVLAACSGGDSAGSPTTAAVTTPSSSVTTTTRPEDAVKAAYLAYWKMIDRLFVSPDPDDAELASTTIEPIYSFLRDDLATRRSEGRTMRFPSDGSLNSHHISNIAISGDSATVIDCFVDGRIAVAQDGSTNEAVVTKQTSGVITRQGASWKVSDVQFVDRTEGVAACAAQ